MMSDNENSMPPNESDEDIYKDISDFNFENVLAKLEGTNETHKQEASDLAEKVKKLTGENEELRKLNETLGKNLSSLLKTAQNEVKRKDSVIEELRVQVDSLIFRKNNKKTRDKSTSTEDLKWVFDFKNVSKDCRGEGDSCTNTSKSFDEKTSFNEYKFKNKKKVQDNIEDEHIFCDNGKNLNYKNSMSKVRDKDWDYRDGRRDSTKYDYFDRERFSSRSYDNHKWPRSRSYRSQRDHHRKQSPRRKRHPQRNRNLSFSRSRSRSRSPQRSRSSKESSLERQKVSRSPHNRNEKTKSRSNSRNKISNSECQKNYLKTLEDKDKAEKSKEKMVKKPEKSQKEEKKTSIKSENKNIDFHYQKSPLDAIYDEMNEEIRSSRRLISNAEKSKLKCGEKVQETEEPQNQSKPEVQEDWTLSFKNERQNKSTPMTVYSRRMMQKLNPDSVTETKVGQAIKNSNTCKKTENFEKENSKEEKLQINLEPLETEKEPGELTEDENEVESSKEFQKLTKIASERNTLLEKCDLQNQEGTRDKGNLCRKIVDKKSGYKKRVELTSVKINNENIEEIPKGETLCFQKDVNFPTEVRGVIEFSPFKNNYKLIEISPLKPLETSKSKRLTPNLFTQNTVESSTFKFLSALSGIPLYKEPKPKTEQNKQETLNKMLISSNVASNEIKSNFKNMNEKSASVENSCKYKISKNQTEPEMQENKITNWSPKKKFETENREETMKPQNAKESNFEKSKSKNTDKDDQSTNLIQNKILPDTLSSSNEKDLKFDKTHDLNIIEQIDLNPTKVSEEENLKFSTSEKDSNSVPKPKPSNAKDDEIMSPTSKEYPASTKTLNSSEVSDSSINNSVDSKKTNVLKSYKNDTLKSQPNSKIVKSKDDSEKKKMRRKSALKNEHKKDTKEGKNLKKKRKLSEKAKSEGINESQDEPMVKRLRSHKDMKSEEGNSNENEKVKEDISFFEFFKPIEKSAKARKTEAEETSNATDFKMTTMSVTNVVCLETPNKGVEKFKNFMINEQTIYQVLDTKSNFSPRIGSNCVEMTPRRLLKNDLMLTDSEDDSLVKIDQKPKLQEETKEKKEDVHDDDENDEISESDNCEWESDSGASDFVDLL